MSATADLLPEVQLRSSSSAELEQRILDAFPSGTYALLGMLQPRACAEQILKFAGDHDGIVCRE